MSEPRRGCRHSKIIHRSLKKVGKGCERPFLQRMQTNTQQAHEKVPHIPADTRHTRGRGDLSPRNRGVGDPGVTCGGSHGPHLLQGESQPLPGAGESRPSPAAAENPKWCSHLGKQAILKEVEHGLPVWPSRPPPSCRPETSENISSHKLLCSHSIIQSS